MENIEKYFEQITNGTVLDVATGTGSFLSRISEYLVSPDKLIGVDSKAEAIKRACDIHNAKPFEFRCMDANKLEFDDNSFDVVTVSNSLHHFENPTVVILEMIRVLKNNGLLVIYEMVRDKQNEKQMTHVLMHDFWGRIDSQLGVYHNNTFTREQIEKMLQENNSLALICYEEELEDNNESADNAQQYQEELQMLENVMLSYVDKAKKNKLNDLESIEEAAKSLMTRLKNVGFEYATECIYILRKNN